MLKLLLHCFWYKDHVWVKKGATIIWKIIIHSVWWCCIGEIVIDKATVQHLMIAADMFQLRELVIGCGEFLKRELHPSNALGIFR